MASTVITNVRVFDGTTFTNPKDVVIEGDLVTSISDHIPNAFSSNTVTGKDKFLIPGLIDCHVHVREKTQLLAQACHGITTVLDMGCWPLTLVNDLKNQTGCADVFSAGAIAFSSDSPHAKIPGVMTHLQPVMTKEEAKNFVAGRVQEESDFVKVVLEGSFDPQVFQTIVEEAKKTGKLSVAHATSVPSYELCQKVGVDVLTHVPLGEPLPSELVQKLQQAGQICVPTLVMMNSVASKFKPGANIGAIMSVKAMHNAGVPILVGTDANEGPGAPAEVPHGSSFKTELHLLALAGMSLLEILRAATIEAAKHFKLTDRGVIEQGKRADLVLLSSNPLEGLAAYNRVSAVFVEGNMVGR